MLTADIVRPDALAAPDRDLWGSLCDSVPEFRNPLLGPEFAAAVGLVRSDAAVAVLKQCGTTVGFFPHHRRPGGFGRPIGAPFSDYHAVVAEAGRPIRLEDAVAAAGLRTFRHTALIEVDTEAQSTADRRDAYAVSLDGLTATVLLEQLRRSDPKRFKNWRRLSHKLEREQGEVSFGADVSRDSFERLLGWKSTQLRRTGLHDVLRAAWVETMMERLFADPSEAFGGLLLTLRVKGVPVAGHFGVRRGPVFHPWIAAFEPEYGAYSPGVLFLLRAIEAMPGMGLTTYDLSAGSDHYKKPFANRRMPIRAGVVRERGTPSSDKPQTELLGRINGRLEQIAAVEPSVLGRLRGVIDAVKDGPKRLGDAASEPTERQP